MSHDLPQSQDNIGFRQFEACTGMRRSAETAHFADGERTHDRGSVSCAATDDLNVGCTAAERIQFATASEDQVEVCGKDIGGAISIFFPGMIENLRRENDRSRGGVGVCFGCVSILRTSQNRQLLLGEIPAGTGEVVANEPQFPAALIANLEEFHQLGAFARSSKENR
jgi:hypothetical protein